MSAVSVPGRRLNHSAPGRSARRGETFTTAGPEGRPRAQAAPSCRTVPDEVICMVRSLSPPKATTSVALSRTSGHEVIESWKAPFVMPTIRGSSTSAAACE